MNAYSAYVNYVRFLCEDVASVKITFTLYRNTTLGGALTQTFGSPVSITVRPNQLPVLPTGSLFGVTVPPSMSAYGIKATTQFLNARGKPAKCSTSPKGCTDDDRMTWMYAVVHKSSNAASKPTNVRTAR